MTTQKRSFASHYNGKHYGYGRQHRNTYAPLPSADELARRVVQHGNVPTAALTPPETLTDAVRDAVNQGLPFWVIEQRVNEQRSGVASEATTE